MVATQNSLRARSVAMVLAIVIAGSVTFVPAQQAHAQTNEQIWTQIQSLLKLVAELQEQLEALRSKKRQTVTRIVSVTHESSDNDDDIRARIQNITSGNRPLISGTATGVDEVGFSIDNGDKVYGSGDIDVDDGRWSHQVSTVLGSGDYTVTLYADGTRYYTAEFTVGSEPTAYDIDITSPHSGETISAGDTITLRWNTENLHGMYGLVTLENNTAERHLEERVSLDDGRMSVHIPTSDHLGRIEGLYELKLWVSYIKDGDPRGVSDTVVVNIEGGTEYGVYKGYMDGNLFITNYEIEREDAYKNCRINVQHNDYADVHCTWNGIIIYDGRLKG